jgi:hypothetical protein
MPYRTSSGPEDYYQQGSNFDPYTGRLQGGNMVLEFLARLAGQKEKAKQDEWAVEDRGFQEEMRGLQKTQAEQGVTKNQQTIQDYRPPMSQAEQDFRARRAAKEEEKRRLREIEAQAKATKSVNAAKPTKTAKELDSDYLSDVAEVEKQYAGVEVSARGELQKAMTAIVNNRVFSPDTFESDIQSAKDQYKEYIDTIAAKKDIALKSIDERYSDLPRAKLSTAKRGRATPTPVPAPTEVYPVGTQRRNKKTGEVQEWDGTKWVAVKK